MVPLGAARRLDRYALARYAEAARTDAPRVRRVRLSTVSQTLNALATVDLSAFYVDVTKDRMYTLAPSRTSGARRRRRCIIICDGLARLLAPILPVTADELWRAPARAAVGVGAPRGLPDASSRLHDRRARWRRGSGCSTVRDEVNAALEEKRKDKVIGNSLGARVTIAASGPIGALLDGTAPTCRCCSSCRMWPCTVGSPDGADDVQDRGREGAGREVRSVLAVSCRRVADRAGLGGHLRSLRRRARRAGQPLMRA